MTIRRALGINGATQGANFLLSIGSVIIVSRLLTPDEIGIFSVSLALIGFAHVLRDFGVGQYLIQAKEVSHEHLRAAFTVMLLTACTLAGLVYLLRTPLAQFYGREGVADVLGLIALNFLIIPFGAPTMSMLNREMKFGRIAIVNLSNNLVQHGVTIACAWAGLSYMSLAWGSIAGMLTNVLLLGLIQPRHMFLLPTFRNLKDVLNFGYKSTASSLLTEFANSSPDLIFGRTLGFSAVAYFSRAIGVINLATGQVLRIVNSVYLPAFAARIRAGDDAGELYGRSINYVVAFTVPLLGFVGLMAEPIIHLMFGHQWTQSATLVSMFTVAGMVAAPFALLGSALVANRQVGLYLRLQLSVQVVRIPILLSSIWLSLEQTVALLVASGLTYMLWRNLTVLKNALGLNLPTLWAHVRPAYLAALMALTGPVLVRLLNHSLQWQLPDIMLLGLSGPLFALGWLAGIKLTKHPLAQELKLLTDKLRRLR